MAETLQSEKDAFEPPNFYGQEAGLENYSAANTGHFLWNRNTRNPDDGAKSHEEASLLNRTDS